MLQSYSIPFFIWLLIFSSFVPFNNTLAQNYRYNVILNGQEASEKVVATLMPFLRINPDTRAGALGEAGIATSPDASSLYFNAAKLAFIEKKTGVTVTHSPWMPRFMEGMSLSYLSAYHRLSEVETIGVSFRYFLQGKSCFSDFGCHNGGFYYPEEFALDLGYARKLSDKMSAGITLKYGNSDLASGVQISSGSIVKPAKTLAGDISVYYQNPDASFLGKAATFSWGAAITNIGNKSAYTEEQTKDFIPVNLGLGTAMDMRLNERNRLMFTIEINKLMIPTPDPNDQTQAHRTKSLLNGMLGSFGDASGGFSEELQELMFSLGVEYKYNDFLALRLGRFYEHESKGTRQYFTTGIGLKYKAVGLDVSYIFPKSKQASYLDKTFRFQLGFDIGEQG
ncbi:MAG: type IX secretion system outer membrane channel protein PorV [Chitinophagales bacterium]